MTKHAIVERIGAVLRRDAREVAAAPLPVHMQDLLTKLAQLEPQWQSGAPSKSVAQRARAS